jgi:hypothetical protein
MAHKHHAGAVETPRGSRLVSPTNSQINWPKPNTSVIYPFVASGVVSDSDTSPFDYINGYFIDSDKPKKRFRGRTMAFPDRTLKYPHLRRWAIYFPPPGPDDPIPVSPVVLHVVAIAVDDEGNPTKSRHDKITLTNLIPIKPPKLSPSGLDSISVTYPTPSEINLCPSNFVPYGYYNPSGTITVTLNIGAGVSASDIYYDPTGHTWAAQFDFRYPGSDLYNMAVTLDNAGAQSHPNPAVNGIQFNDC